MTFYVSSENLWAFFFFFVFENVFKKWSMVMGINRDGEVAPQLRALAAVAEDLGSIPTTHVAVYNCLQLQF